jgi:hypothetical protein
LSSSPDDSDFRSSENKDDRRRAQYQSCFGEEITETKATAPKICPEFESRGDYRNKDHNIEKMFWVRVSVNMVSEVSKLRTIE